MLQSGKSALANPLNSMENRKYVSSCGNYASMEKGMVENNSV